VNVYNDERGASIWRGVPLHEVGLLYVTALGTAEVFRGMLEHLIMTKPSRQGL
jgi:hypothetical protein